MIFYYVVSQVILLTEAAARTQVAMAASNFELADLEMVHVSVHFIMQQLAQLIRGRWSIDCHRESF